jgi:hypothetical protein
MTIFHVDAKTCAFILFAAVAVSLLVLIIPNADAASLACESGEGFQATSVTTISPTSNTDLDFQSLLPLGVAFQRAITGAPTSFPTGFRRPCGHAASAPGLTRTKKINSESNRKRCLAQFTLASYRKSLEHHLPLTATNCD